MDWFSKLFSIDGYATRDTCGAKDGLAIVYQVANALTFFACLSMMESFRVIAKHVKTVAPEIRSWVISAIMYSLSCFFLLTAIVNLDDVLAYHFPSWNFFVMMDVLQGFFSIIVAIIFPFVIWFEITRMKGNK